MNGRAMCLSLIACAAIGCQMSGRPLKPDHALQRATSDDAATSSEQRTEEAFPAAERRSEDRSAAAQEPSEVRLVAAQEPLPAAGASGMGGSREAEDVLPIPQELAVPGTERA